MSTRISLTLNQEDMDTLDALTLLGETHNGPPGRRAGAVLHRYLIERRAEPEVQELIAIRRQRSSAAARNFLRLVR